MKKYAALWESSDPDEIKEAVTHYLTRKRFPSSAALRAHAVHKAREEAEEIVPFVLDYFEKHGDGDPEEMRGVIGSLIASWVSALVLELVIAALRRWWMSSESGNYRMAMQARQAREQ